MSGQGDVPVALLYCSCEQQPSIWGEFWWVGGKYQWVFFDDQAWSGTYNERLTHCPGCGLHLERMNLGAVKAVRG
jgi:hypothetical protein